MPIPTDCQREDVEVRARSAARTGNDARVCQSLGLAFLPPVSLRGLPMSPGAQPCSEAKKGRLTGKLALTVALHLAVSACTTSWPSHPGEMMIDVASQRGRDLAVRRCSGCHTVEHNDFREGDGPSFRSLAFRYNRFELLRRFNEVAEHGYDRMPPITFNERDAEDLVAYFDTFAPPE